MRSCKGFTLLELLIVIAIIAVLMAILLPAGEHVRHQAYIENCASNLRQIGLAFSNYGNENHGNYPRTTYQSGAALTQGTGSASADPFGAGGPQANDLTASVYLLLRTQHLPPVIFTCPYDDEFTYTPDTADPQTHANFTDWTVNLGYSFANPYPDDTAAKAGYSLTTHMSAAFAVAADRNPGINPPRSDVTAAAPGLSDSKMEKSNSINHEQDGQNVLYGDGHVQFQTTPLVGISNDNIFDSQSGQVTASPVSAGDSVLLPAK